MPSTTGSPYQGRLSRSAKSEFVELLPATRSFNGCIYIYLTKDQDDPGKLTIIELWERRDHYDAYLSWRTERADMAELAMMMGQPSWRFLDMWCV